MWAGSSLANSSLVLGGGYFRQTYTGEDRPLCPRLLKACSLSSITAGLSQGNMIASLRGTWDRCDGHGPLEGRDALIWDFLNPPNMRVLSVAVGGVHLSDLDGDVFLR